MTSLTGISNSIGKILVRAYIKTLISIKIQLLALSRLSTCQTVGLVNITCLTVRATVFTPVVSRFELT